MRRALEIDEKSLGTDHPDVATHLNNLAALLLATNRLTEAKRLMRPALEIDEKSLGPDHPDIATDLHNLAQLLQATNRLTEAESLMRWTLVIFLKFTRETGHEHPHLRMVFGAYCTLLKKMAMQQEEVFKRIGTLRTEAGFDSESYFKLVQQIAQ